jgi:hypothetical protein
MVKLIPSDVTTLCVSPEKAFAAVLSAVKALFFAHTTEVP